MAVADGRTGEAHAAHDVRFGSAHALAGNSASYYCPGFGS